MRAVVQRLLGILGYRLERVNRPVGRAEEIPPMADDPIAAWYRSLGGKPTAFRCPLSMVRYLNGMGLGPDGWHPFVATARQIIEGTHDRYEGSVLEWFYDHWRPEDAAEGLLCFGSHEGPLAGLPNHLISFLPWVARSLEEQDAWVRKWIRSEFRTHGIPEARLETDGHKMHGPTSPIVGRMEFRRLRHLVEALAGAGYDRSFGDTRVEVLIRGDELRFLQRGGLHRTAVLSALGESHVPARISGMYNFRHVESWPQVVEGGWSVEAARVYVDHVMDFDSLHWAEVRGAPSTGG